MNRSLAFAVIVQTAAIGLCMFLLAGLAFCFRDYAPHAKWFLPVLPRMTQWVLAATPVRSMPVFGFLTVLCGTHLFIGLRFAKYGDTAGTVFFLTLCWSLLSVVIVGTLVALALPFILVYGEMVEPGMTPDDIIALALIVLYPAILLLLWIRMNKRKQVEQTHAGDGSTRAK